MSRYDFSLSEQIGSLIEKALGKAPQGFKFNEKAAFRLYDIFNFFAMVFPHDEELELCAPDFGINFWPGQLAGGEYPIKILIEFPSLQLSGFYREMFVSIIRGGVDYFSVVPIDGCVQLEMRINGAYIPQN